MYSFYVLIITALYIKNYANVCVIKAGNQYLAIGKILYLCH